MLYSINTNDVQGLCMSMESTYLVCSETLVFLLFVGGIMTLVIDNWLKDFIGFVIFYYCNSISFFVMACCTYCIFQGYINKSVMLVARSALIFNFSTICSFVLVALEWSKDDKPHEIHAHFFVRSSNANYDWTIPYIVIGVSLCAILVILHCCIYQQLQHTFDELRSEPHVKMYNYINMLVESISASGMDKDFEDSAEEFKDDSVTKSKENYSTEDSDKDLRMDSNRLQRILHMFEDVKDAQESDSIHHLIRIVVRTFLLMLIILYDTKACLESTTNGYLELAPSMVFILYLTIQDGIEHAYNKQQNEGILKTILLLSLLFLLMSYVGVLVTTLVFYIEDRSSDFLSDIRKTWLNNVLVCLMTLDFVLCVYRVSVLFFHKREPTSETAKPLDDAEDSDSNFQGKVKSGIPVGVQDPIKVTPAATALGGKIRVLEFAKGGRVTFDLGQTYKKNK